MSNKQYIYSVYNLTIVIQCNSVSILQRFQVHKVEA